MEQTDKKASSNAEGLSLTSIFVSTILKTTAFIFVPTLGLFGVGALIDLNFGSKPVGMLVGVSVGFVVAALLIVFQIRKIKKGKK